MPIPIAFFGITILMVTFFHVARKSSSTQLNEYRRYLDDEQAANFSRRNDPDPGEYLTVDVSKLPIREYPDERKYQRVADRQKNVQSLAAAPMLALDHGMTNRELKMKFGAVNLDMLITYEDNYNQFIHNLLEWTMALVSLGNQDDAATVLEAAIEYRCDRSQAYTLLADIFARNGEHSKLKALRSRTEVCEALGDAARNRALTHIDSLIERGTI